VNLVEVYNSTRVALDCEAVALLVTRVLEAEDVYDAELSVVFVGERRIRTLNREHRGRDEVTDVLSFPLEDAGEEPGDGARQALRQARAEARPPAFELAVLLAHGTLHLLGYDHEADAGEMALRQAEVLGLVTWEGLLVATQG